MVKEAPNLDSKPTIDIICKLVPQIWLDVVPESAKFHEITFILWN